MKNLYYNIRANIYKFLHSKIILLHLLVPIIAIVVFCGYYNYSTWSEMEKVFLFIQAVAMAFPIMISFAITMVYEQELKAGNFQSILTAPYSKVAAHLGVLLTIGFFGLISCFLTFMGFGVIFRCMGFVILPIGFYFKTTFILFASNITLYIIQYILCFTYGNGLSLGFGIVGTLMSPLLYLGLGDGIWKYIPFGYGVRIGTYYFYKNTDTELYYSIENDFNTGILVVGGIILILLVFFIAFSERWQGAVQSDE
jgi:lantibiotic transport system permease protein